MYTTQKYDDGSYYVGHLNERNQRDGTGKIYWGVMYFDGLWSCDKPVRGKYSFSNGYKYEGEVSNDGGLVITGNGTSYFPDGNIYVGYHNKGNPSCNGTFYYKNGNIEKGFWVNGKLSTGKLILADGCVYKGDFYYDDNGLKIKGTYTRVYGESYKGEFVNMKPEGQCTCYYYKKKIDYQGEFKNGDLTGEGICELKDYKYKGYFKNGKICGQGMMNHKNRSGTSYGFFKKGIPHGYIVLENQIMNINVIEGYYNGSKFKGNVNIIYDDKREYGGRVKGFIPYGEGIMKYPDGNIVIGRFKKGNPDGEVTILCDSKKYEGLYKKGKCIRKREWVIEL